MKTSFKSTGTVLGLLWGGGTGAYPATNLTETTKEKLLEKAIKGLDGSLDSGMGFERLLGAKLIITKITTRNIRGKEFINEETELEFIGELNNAQKDFVSSCYF